MTAAPWALWALLLTASAADAPELEREAAAQVRREFERVGRAAPALDPPLQAAARALAREALAAGAGRVAGSLEISARVSDAGGFDPAPRAVVIRAGSPEQALESFAQRRDFNEEPATHLGVGAAEGDGRAVLVALLADRKVVMEAFPRTFRRAGGVRPLCGELSSGLAHPEIFVTRPGGSVDKVPLTREAGARFCASVPFPSAGRHSVEAIARGPRGPEVVSVFHVSAGVRGSERSAASVPEPTTLPASREAILARVNALRRAQAAPEVAQDARLDALAQAYADQMVRERFFAHVSPAGDDLTARLSRAGYAYAQAGENLGLASGPLDAHFGIEHSPGHRKNLLVPEYSRLGIGVAWDQERAQVLVVEVLAQPGSPPVANPLEAAYRALDRIRESEHLPPLKRSEALERIASSHVQQALQQDAPREKLPGSEVHDRVFDALGGVRAATVDIFVGDDPGALPRSHGVADARNDWVGVGAVRGDSPTYGKQKYWVVVIYASSR